MPIVPLSHPNSLYGRSPWPKFSNYFSEDKVWGRQKDHEKE
jgi:hypothetical protein